MRERDPIMKSFIINVRLVAVMLVLCSGLYPLVIWATGRVAFPGKAEGSLIRRADATVVGSRLIGQSFTSPRYFLGRPSAVDYNAAASGGSNLAPTNPALFARMADSVTSASELDHLTTRTIASDRIYASGSGLDPDITPENARQQVARVARERHLDPKKVAAVVDRHISQPLPGILGPQHVNVLQLNLDIDAETSSVTSAKER